MSNLLNKKLLLTGSLLGGILVLILFATPGLSPMGKTALFIFGTSIVLWTTTKIDANLVALLGAFAMAITGLNTAEKPLLSALGDPFIILLIAGFMLGEAWQVSGLSTRIAKGFARYSSNVAGMFYMLTTALLILSFIIPSTSARAAVMAPVYLSIAAATDNRNIRRALALLFPSIIVLSCITSYLGAGANLITADLIQRFYGTKISYTAWLLLGGPIGVLSCFSTTWILLRVFLSPEERRTSLKITPEPDAGVEKKDEPSLQLKTVLVSFTLIGLWMTEIWHGIDPGLIAMGGAIYLCLPNFGVLNFKTALKKIEWPLIVFMAATIEISNGLLNSGSIDYLMGGVSASIKQLPATGVLVAIIGVSLLSHLLINSRTARVTVLLPLLLPMAVAVGQSGALLAFIANAAMGYCLTLTISAKPVALFSTIDEDSYSSRDLLRLSGYLLPLHLVLLIGTYYAYAALGW